jgi:hypothetical protein
MRKVWVLGVMLTMLAASSCYSQSSSEGLWNAPVRLRLGVGSARVGQMVLQEKTNYSKVYLAWYLNQDNIKSNWHWQADLGLISLNPGGMVHLGRTLADPKNLDDWVRELRLSPTIQVQLTYGF